MIIYPKPYTIPVKKCLGADFRLWTSREPVFLFLGGVVSAGEAAKSNYCYSGVTCAFKGSVSYNFSRQPETAA